ncbi:beta-N-acetylhexosaminidase [Chitinophaga sp. Mgbs1]|uniref:beta-N-acetylhexosaminidase n=1 Tax=Chitinophaga solisilvae TaxID=1233460 RepID=A0A3S1BKE3_9BACT|nr:beta-N-acetylhexosaminidase [Chitinophaga solisilvae]
MKPLLFSALFLFTMLQAIAQTCPVIPLPAQYQPGSESFALSKRTAVIAKDASLQPVAAFLREQLLQQYELPAGKATANKIILEHNSNGAPADAYTLRMSENNIHITAAGPEGAFNAVATLLQLTASATRKKDALYIPAWNIDDKPYYTWRGLMLDESRHFFGKEKVKSILDWMAFYKLNRFHWHLTDAPGWRLEIKKYPLLTTIGGIGNHHNPEAPAQFYTQDDIREIVAYAQARYITVIPEIDMPGHASAANRAYPAFDGGGTEKYPSFTFNPGREGTYQYLANILQETDALFPSQMIHLGGDEVTFGNKGWESDTGVIRLMQSHGLTSRKAVEDYFIQRMADTVIGMHNKVLAWDEVATATLPVNKTIVCWWRQDKPENLRLALDKGYQVILCPRLPFYFDFVQDSSHKIGRRWAKGELNNIQSVYDFDASRLPAAKDHSNNILGVQACLWTEVIADNRRLDFMLFPRISALAETAWTAPEKKNAAQFFQRLQSHLQLYQQHHLYYFDMSAPDKHPETGKPTNEKYID